MKQQQQINEWMSIERPARYIGGEVNMVVKESGVHCRMLLAFPNTYEIGMSHLGMRILYDLINKTEHLAAERAFAPWPDRERQMRSAGQQLSSLETGRTARQFDLIGFSLQSELDFTNILTLLDLGNIPLRAADRDANLPLVIAGGPVAFNPEPLSPFIDLFLLGDAEEVLPDLMQIIADRRTHGSDKNAILRAAAGLDGIYAPALYTTRIDRASGLQVVVPPDGKDYPFIRKALLPDLDNHPFPQKILVPNCDIVHDRASVEITRGCSRGCRFCQAGVIYMPERQRSPQSISDSIEGMLQSTGYADVSLTALTPNDYEALSPLITRLMERYGQEGVSLSLASLSPSDVDEKLLELIRGVRKTGLTIAPEAGSQRLRDVINKNITEEQVITTADKAFKLGWKLIKLYFMIGLPTETDDDVRSIARLARRVADLRRGASVRLGCSSFIPKSHTPLQWVAMDTPEELERKQQIIFDELHGTRIHVSMPDVRDTVLEGVLSRGDRRVGSAIERAWELGCRFDGWGDQLRFDLWQQAFAETGVEPHYYNHRPLLPLAPLPWSHIDSGVRVEFLREEYQKALAGIADVRCTPENCPRCRACPPELLKKRWQTGHIENKDVDVPPPRQQSRDQQQRTRMRLRFSKTGAMLGLGHLDMMRAVARTFRRAEVNVAMSQGFHPQPRIAVALALPLGQEGHNEYLDAQLLEPPEPQQVLERLNRAAPHGLRFTGATPIDTKRSLSADLAAAEYRVARKDGRPFSKEDAVQFLELKSLPWQRRHKGKCKEFDVRAEVLGLEETESWDELRLHLRIGPGLNARPAEVMEAAFGLQQQELLIVRKQLYVSRDGNLVPPM